jgi:hypothetical protein
LKMTPQPSADWSQSWACPFSNLLATVSVRWNAPNNQGPMLWFLKYFRRTHCKKLAFLTPSKAKLCKILIIALVFEKTTIFCRKLAKIAENCDHNIDNNLITVTYVHVFHLILTPRHSQRQHHLNRIDKSGT